MAQLTGIPEKKTFRCCWDPVAGGQAPDRCSAQCDDCKWGERMIKEGKWQNIFVDPTNDLNEQ